MNTKQAEEILAALKSKAMTFDQLQDHARASGNPWSTDQLRLFLRCLPDIERDPATETFRARGTDPDSELRDAIVAAARSFGGRPVPPAEIRRRLPQHFVTTDEQVRAIAKRTSELTIVGPGLIRIAS